MGSGARSDGRDRPAAGVSRRQFLGGSVAAAVGSLSIGTFGPGARGAAAGQLAGALDGLRPTGTLDEAYWQVVRKEFNIADDMAYMNNGTLGPMPRSVVDAQVRYLRDLAADPRARGNLEAVREKLAAFVGADPDEVILTRSTTEGMKIFCEGLDLEAGDEILMSSHEHPGGYGPWRAREAREGITIKTVEIPAPPDSTQQVIDICERAITPRTRVLVVSYPIFVTGLLMPITGLAEMARRRGVLLSVDGAHALGMLDLDMHGFGVDHFTTAGQKWLLAGTGTGMAYIRRDIQDQVAPDMWRANPSGGPQEYERVGQRHMPSALGMGDAVDFHMAIGKRNIEARVRQLATRLKDGLREIAGVELGTSGAAEMSGGLTTFYIPGVPKATTQRVAMEREGIYFVGSGLNDFACRVSTHFYNTPAQVDGVLAAVRHITDNSGTYQATA